MTFFKWIAYLLYPPRCPYCGIVLPMKESCCKECKKELCRIKPPLCKICGARVYDCINIKNPHNFNFERSISPFYYEKAARKGILRLKIAGKKSGSFELAREMAQAISHEYSGIDFDFIIPVPMSKHEIKKRGFNQALLLASHLSKLLNVPLKENCLIKEKDTKQQHKLNFTQRAINLKNAFKVINLEELKNSTILLCDDIMTSGSTLNECSLTLRKHGVRQVYCVTFARTKVLKGNKTS